MCPLASVVNLSLHIRPCITQIVVSFVSRAAFHRPPTPAAQELLVYVFSQERVRGLCDSLEQSRWRLAHAYDSAGQRSVTGVSVLEQGA